MKELIQEVDLLNRNTGVLEPAALYRELDEQNFADFEKVWKPLIDARLLAAGSSAEIANANIQDWHWDWRSKAKARERHLASDSFAIEADGHTQGMMFTTSAAFARIESQKGLDLVFVDYLATAPWNRKGFSKSPRYKGVGRILLIAAVSLSYDLGFKGRIGLHALPQSESWYRNECGMIDLGADPTANPPILHYFEMTEAQAKAFIK